MKSIFFYLTSNSHGQDQLQNTICLYNYFETLSYTYKLVMPMAILSVTVTVKTRCRPHIVKQILEIELASVQEGL